MKRVSSYTDYRSRGEVIVDADGIHVDVPDRSDMDAADTALGQRIDGKADSSAMEAADTALGQRIDAEKWRKPGLISDSLDTYNSVAHEGVHSVRATTPGNPWNLPGWVTVVRNPADGRVKQIFRPSNAGETWTAQRVFGGGSWTNWIRDSWDKGGLGSSDDLDLIHGSDSVGHYPLLSGVQNSPEGINGFLEVTYDRGTESTQQIVWSTIHTENGVAYRRMRRGGVWYDWTQVGWGSRQISSTGDLDDQVRPGNYHVSSSYTANAPVTEPGNMVVQIANNVIIQTFVTSGFHPRTFVRSRTAGMWSAWSEPGRRVSRPMSWDASTSETKLAHRIPAYMTHSGRYYWSVRAYRLLLSEDAGKTWDSDPIWLSEGEGSETLRELPNGELLLVADHVGGDRIRDVWVSSGMSTNPRTATWTKTLPGRAPHIKYTDGWSISVHENMVLLAEYGPKSFGTWQGTYIEEGQNARYVYLSEDYGMTWRTIFDLNTWLYAQGRTGMEHQHMHGVAYDPWWNRIWLTWGDNVAGKGSNGILYSDDLGLTWETAMFVSDPGGTGIEGSPQVVGILPMEKCVLFGGDQYPSGVMRIDRAGGKTRANWSWQVAYQHHTGRHLCGAITPVTLPNGDKAAWFQFVPEGVSTTSFVVATRDGWDWDVLWESDVDDRLSALVGPTPDGEMIGGYLPSGSSDWVEVRGRVDLYRTDAGSGAEILRIIENRLGNAL